MLLENDDKIINTCKENCMIYLLWCIRFYTTFATQY